MGYLNSFNILVEEGDITKRPMPTNLPFFPIVSDDVTKTYISLLPPNLVWFIRISTNQHWASLTCIPASLCRTLKAKSSLRWFFAFSAGAANPRSSAALVKSWGSPKVLTFAKVRNDAMDSSGQAWAGRKCQTTHSLSSRLVHDIHNPVQPGALLFSYGCIINEVVIGCVQSASD